MHTTTEYQHDQGHLLSSNQVAVVHSTHNYSQFRFSNANRPIDQRHLERLYTAVSIKNMLDKYPILVTPGLLVIDGQHRLKVAEALHVPIYYIIADNMAVDDIRAINDVTLKWRMEDYLHFWCEMGNEEYKLIEAFRKKYRGVSLSFIVQYLATKTGEVSWAEQWRRGMCNTRRLPRLVQIVNLALDFRPYLDKYWAGQPFMYAVQTLTDTPGYNHETMMKRLEYQPTRLVRCNKVDEYIALLSDIYNYRTREENKLNFSVYRYQQRKLASQARRDRSNLN